LLIGLQQVEALNHHQETGNVSVNEKKNQLIDMRPIIYDIQESGSKVLTATLSELYPQDET
jgi:hypothetical protein